MLKVLGVLHRRADLSLDAFRLHWHTVHRGLALRLGHANIVTGYVQNHRLDIDVEGLVPFADGMPELWFEDPARFDGMRASRAYQHGAFHDSDRFMDTARYQSVVLEAETDVAAPSRRECAGLLKAIFVLDEPLDDARIADGEPSLTMGDVAPIRLSYHRAYRGSVSARRKPCGGIETSWWPDLDTFRAAWARRPKSQVEGILVEERPIHWPGDPVPPADWSPVVPSSRPQS